MQPKVSTVVLNWNGWRDTFVCLESLSKLKYPNHEVVVVDNGSTNDSVLRLRKRFPWVKVLETGRNLGFAAGCNFGIKHAFATNATYIWLLNNDTRVEPLTLNGLIAKAESDRRVGAVGSAIYSMQKPQDLQAWGGGCVNFWVGRSRHFIKPVADEKVDYITGASLLVRRSALESVGLLDEDFFFFWEDADLGFRLRNAHWKLAVAGEARIWHKLSSSLQGRDLVLDQYFNQSAKTFFRKHALAPQIPFYLGIGLRTAKRLLAGDWKRARVVWAAGMARSGSNDKSKTKTQFARPQLGANETLGG